jgi:hypothetical protein
MAKHSTLLRKFFNYGEEMFYYIGPRSQSFNAFLDFRNKLECLSVGILSTLV